MIEEKTKEPQSQAPAAPVKGREKLRSFWAKVQITGLLRRHRFRRKTQRHMNDVAKKLRASAVVLAVGEALYALGFAAEYMVVRTGRGIAAVAHRLARWCRNALHTISATAFPGAAQMFKDLLAPLYLFFKGLGAVAAHANDVRRERGFGASVKAAGRYFVGGLKRNLSLLPRTAMYILPLCMLAVFVTVWNRTMAQPYALAVQVNGQTVGYVANEEVFNLAKEDVMQRINYAGSDKTELTIEPTYTISVTHKTMDESETANAILQSASDQIGEGTALYLDGELTAVCSDGDTLRSYLESLLAPYEDQTDENISVGFNKNVTLEDGIYFNDSFEDDNSIENMLTGVQQQEKIYTVRAGDTLWDIAQKNDLTFRELCALNTHRDHPVQRVHQGYHQDPAGGPERPAPRHHAERLRYQWRAAGADHPFHRDHPGAGEQKGGRWHQEGHEERCGGVHRRQRSVHLACAGLPLLLALVWQRP